MQGTAVDSGAPGGSTKVRNIVHAQNLRYVGGTIELK